MFFFRNNSAAYTPSYLGTIDSVAPTLIQKLRSPEPVCSLAKESLTCP